MTARTPGHHLPGLAAGKLVHGVFGETARRRDIAGAHLHDAAAMARAAQHLIGDAERIHDVERKQRNVRSLQHVAAGVEHEVGRRLGLGVAAGLLAQPREQFVVELHLRNVGDVARDLAEAVDALTPPLRRLILVSRHRHPRHAEHEARIDAVVAGLDAFAAEHARVRPFARRLRAVAGAQDVDDAGDHGDGLGVHAAGAGDRTDLDALAAAGAGVRHRLDACGQRGFEGGGHAGTTFHSPSRVQITASALAMKPHPHDGLDELALARCGVVVDVLDRGGPDHDPARCAVGGIGVRGNLRQGIVEFSNGIQGFARRSFHGAVSASDSLRERRTGRRSGRRLRDVPILGGCSPHRPRPHRRCRRRLALLHRLPGPGLLGCGLSSRQFLACGFLRRGHCRSLRCRSLRCRRLRCRCLRRRYLWRCYLWRCYLGRGVFGCRRPGCRVIGCGRLGSDLPGGRVPGCETLRYGDLRREQLRLGKLAHGELRRGWLRCGRCLPAFRQSLLGCRFKRGLDRAGVRGPACRGPGQAALGTVPIEVQPPLLRAGGGGRRLGNVGLGEQWPINGKQQGRHADGDHASEGDQGGGDDETQMRVQGPSPSGRPRASAEFRARLTVAAGLCPFGGPAPSGNRNCV